MSIIHILDIRVMIVFFFFFGRSKDLAHDSLIFTIGDWSYVIGDKLFVFVDAYS